MNEIQQQEKICPKCNSILEPFRRKNLAYDRYKCLNCNTVFREEKSNITLIEIAKELQKQTNILYYIVCLLLIPVFVALIYFIILLI